MFLQIKITAKLWKLSLFMAAFPYASQLKVPELLFSDALSCETGIFYGGII